MTTVGYGDINSKMAQEFTFTLFWLAFGTVFYGLLIGQMTQIYEQQDMVSIELSNKLNMFSFFSSKIGLPETTNTRVEKYLNNNQNPKILRFKEY